MSAYLYDQSLVEKFRRWTASTDVHVYGPDDTRRLFEVKAEETNDSPIALPIICLRRKPTLSITNPNRRMMAVHGLKVIQTSTQGISLPAIPIKLDYQIDVYTRYLAEAEEFVRNIVFNIVNYPKLSIQIPYNGLNYEHNAYIKLASGAQNNSDIPERLIAGQFTRYTLDIYLEDAYMWDVKLKDNKSITAYLSDGIEI